MKISLRHVYRKTFESLGRPLKARHAVSEAQVASAERKLGTRLPAALRDYYLVAGRERQLNHAFHRLVAPRDWEIHRGMIIFLAENQCVVVWGVRASSQPARDPVVYQASVGEEGPGKWSPVCRSCSGFLLFIIHMQASYGGGMKCYASATVPAGLVKTLDQTWQFAGEVHEMRAYSRSGQALCIAKWRDDFEASKSWRVFVGAVNQRTLDSIAADLDLTWDEQ